MSGLILGFFGMIVVFVGITYLANHLLSVYIGRMIGGRLDDIDQLVNEEKVPGLWLQPFRQKFIAARRSGADAEALARIGEHARQQCLRKLDDLLKYSEYVRLADTPETKELVLDSLRVQRTRWVEMTGAAWMAYALQTEDVATGGGTGDARLI